jgi:hypothetical protein
VKEELWKLLDEDVKMEFPVFSTLIVGGGIFELNVKEFVNTWPERRIVTGAPELERMPLE